MLRSVKALHGYTVHATDGDIGVVDEFFFDDERWVVRYLVVDTGGWLVGRKVLVSPISFGTPDWETRRFDVNLTRQQVEDSPTVDTEAPMSRRQERGYFGFFGWPVYWSGTGHWGASYYPGIVAVPDAGAPASDAGEEGDVEYHIKSTREVSGYRVLATDGEIGRVEDFVLDVTTWAIRYLSIDTGGWWSGRKVLVPPAWIERVDWTLRDIVVDHTQEEIREAPAWDPHVSISRGYEQALHDHFKREGYWEAESRAA
jgi:sporulation protein YlmC with PRC-barrel domain